MTVGKLDEEVGRALATDKHYPLGEGDAMKWAIAFRMIWMRRFGSPPMPIGDFDGLMCGWFANCMATGEMQATGGTFLNADGAQSILDGEIDPHPEFGR